MDGFVKLDGVVINKTFVCSVEIKRLPNGALHYVEIRTPGGRVDCVGKDADLAIKEFFEADLNESPVARVN